MKHILLTMILLVSLTKINAENDPIDYQEYYKDHKKVNTQNTYGITDLHKAIKDDDYRRIQYLIEKAKANLNLADLKGRTPLHWAAQYNNVFAIRALIKAGDNVNKVTALGIPPLHDAAANESLDAIAALVDCHADIDLQNGLGNTALHNALYGIPRPNVVKKLIEYGADRTIKNNRGETPEDIAARKKIVL